MVTIAEQQKQLLEASQDLSAVELQIQQQKQQLAKEQELVRKSGGMVGGLASQLRSGSAFGVSISRQQVKQQKTIATKQIKQQQQSLAQTKMQIAEQRGIISTATKDLSVQQKVQQKNVSATRQRNEDIASARKLFRKSEQGKRVNIGGETKRVKTFFKQLQAGKEVARAIDPSASDALLTFRAVGIVGEGGGSSFTQRLQTSAIQIPKTFVGPVRPADIDFVGPIKPASKEFVGPPKPEGLDFVGPRRPSKTDLFSIIKPKELGPFSNIQSGSFAPARTDLFSVIKSGKKNPFSDIQSGSFAPARTDLFSIIKPKETGPFSNIQSGSFAFFPTKRSPLSNIQKPDFDPTPTRFPTARDVGAESGFLGGLKNLAAFTLSPSKTGAISGSIRRTITGEREGSGFSVKPIIQTGGFLAEDTAKFFRGITAEKTLSDITKRETVRRPGKIGIERELGIIGAGVASVGLGNLGTLFGPSTGGVSLIIPKRASQGPLVNILKSRKEAITRSERGFEILGKSAPEFQIQSLIGQVSSGGQAQLDVETRIQQERIFKGESTVEESTKILESLIPKIKEKQQKQIQDQFNILSTERQQALKDVGFESTRGPSGFEFVKGGAVLGGLLAAPATFGLSAVPFITIGAAEGFQGISEKDPFKAASGFGTAFLSTGVALAGAEGGIINIKSLTKEGTIPKSFTPKNPLKEIRIEGPKQDFSRLTGTLKGQGAKRQIDIFGKTIKTGKGRFFQPGSKVQFKTDILIEDLPSGREPFLQRSTQLFEVGAKGKSIGFGTGEDIKVSLGIGKVTLQPISTQTSIIAPRQNFLGDFGKPVETILTTTKGGEPTSFPFVGVSAREGNIIATRSGPITKAKEVDIFATINKGGVRFDTNIQDILQLNLDDATLTQVIPKDNIITSLEFLGGKGGISGNIPKGGGGVQQKISQSFSNFFGDTAVPSVVSFKPPIQFSSSGSGTTSAAAFQGVNLGSVGRRQAFDDFQILFQGQKGGPKFGGLGGSLVGPKTKTVLKDSDFITPKPISVQKVSPSFRDFTKLTDFTAVSPSTTQIQGVLPIQTLGLKNIQLQASKLETKLLTKLDTALISDQLVGQQTTPFAQPGFSSPPFDGGFFGFPPPFGIPSEKLGRRKPTRKRSRAPTKVAPSFTADVFDLRGTFPESTVIGGLDLGILPGKIRTRPIKKKKKVIKKKKATKKVTKKRKKK